MSSGLRVGYSMGLIHTSRQCRFLDPTLFLHSRVGLSVSAMSVKMYSMPFSLVKLKMHVGQPASRWQSPRVDRSQHTTCSFARAVMGSSRVDLQACKLEYSIVSPK